LTRDGRRLEDVTDGNDIQGGPSMARAFDLSGKLVDGGVAAGRM
jgi:hypothetical protein